MSIGNELSCDVAAAMLASAEGKGDRDLTEIVLTFHSALRRLNGEERQRRRAQLPAPAAETAANSQGAAGGH